MAGKGNKLTDEQKMFVIGHLAGWETPSDVVELVRETYGIEITRQTAEAYDPTKYAGRNLGKRWREHFDKAREAARSDVSAIPEANKAVRVRELAKMARQAQRVKNLALAANLYEQIAKEVGEAFTNRRELTGKGGGPIGYRDMGEMTDEQIDAELNAIFATSNAAADDAAGGD